LLLNATTIFKVIFFFYRLLKIKVQGFLVELHEKTWKNHRPEGHAHPLKG
jgi:hypothetical protein